MRGPRWAPRRPPRNRLPHSSGRPPSTATYGPRSPRRSTSSSRASPAEPSSAGRLPARRCARPRTRLDRLRAAQQDLEAAETAAADAEWQAHQQHAEAELRLIELDLAHERQADLLTDVQARLDHLLEEAQALASRDAELAAQIMQREAALAAQAAAAAAQAAAAAKARENADQRHAAGARLPVERHRRACDRRRDRGRRRDRRSARADARGRRSRRPDPRGRRVAQPRRADRHPHGGVRHERVRHLGDALVGVLAAGRSPGAVDARAGPRDRLHPDGDLIRSRSHPAFSWLADNAERFGFYNLPSEPWHWSTTGS